MMKVRSRRPAQQRDPAPKWLRCLDERRVPEAPESEGQAARNQLHPGRDPELDRAAQWVRSASAGEGGTR